MMIFDQYYNKEVWSPNALFFVSFERPIPATFSRESLREKPPNCVIDHQR